MHRAVLILLLAACGREREAAARLFDEIKLDTAPGLSGLAVDATGGMWTMGEREHRAYRISLDASNHPTLETYEVEGTPASFDLEGIAWLGGDQFALGTEGKVAGIATVLLAERRADSLVVTSTIELPAERLGVALPANHGAEGVCGAGTSIMVAIEGVGVASGKRFAPIVRISDGQITAVHRLWLTTRTGKLSALDCSIGADGTAQLLAVERHFEVTKLLRFTVPPAPSDGDLVPTEVLDLGPVLKSRLNLEGIAQLPDGRIIAVTDNQWKTLQGPSVLLVFRAGVVD